MNTPESARRKQLFSNKHVIAALLVAPILAILGYFAVDVMVSEKPHRARVGESYPLVAKPNCRYSSGRCSFKNGDFEVHLVLEEKESLVLTLESEFPLQGGRASLIQPELDNSEPIELVPVDASNTRWQASYDIPYTGAETLRIVVNHNGTFYFGETVAAFAHYEPSFGKDFRRDQ